MNCLSASQEGRVEGDTVENSGKTLPGIWDSACQAIDSGESGGLQGKLSPVSEDLLLGRVRRGSLSVLGGVLSGSSGVFAGVLGGLLALLGCFLIRFLLCFSLFLGVLFCLLLCGGGLALGRRSR
jgi:hypothetical protein